MTTIRAVGLLCITLIICVGMVLGYMHVKTPSSDLSFIKINKGVLVFDRKSQVLNYCTNKDCIAVSANFLAQPKPQTPVTWVPCPASQPVTPGAPASYPPVGYMPVPQITPANPPITPAAVAPAPTPTTPQQTTNQQEEDEEDDL